ncbi:hypothetical protein J2T50_001211 [Streptococcus gallinaceus]|uniref:Uncharacterized protein n=1 Tax=Streptococcus gallinaceus TaxID=165758 RepID=A0ABV2JMA5_9STRE|nr:hypothetical protein [Streptococcus gallinaceus]MCP1770294.1 hypothetical protein [Streptococcus gallinaceus]
MKSEQKTNKEEYPGKKWLTFRELERYAKLHLKSERK